MTELIRVPLVLIVDDDESLRLLCRVNLELDGYTVVEATGVGHAKEMLAAGSGVATTEAPAPPPMDDVKDPQTPAERKMRPTQAPERGVDWGDVATEGSRVVRSGTFNTIMKAILGLLSGGRRR